MGWTPDRKRKSTENSCFYSIENYRAWSSMMTICFRLNKIFLDHSPVFFIPLKPGTHKIHFAGRARLETRFFLEPKPERKILNVLISRNETKDLIE